MSTLIHQQLHGYRNGHQLLQSSVRLDRKDQDLIDHLSDMAGSLRPGEKFDPYMSAYPLPSLKYYALTKTEQDLDAPRAGCVTTKTFLVPMHFWENEASPAVLAELLEGPTSDKPVAVPTHSQAPTLTAVNNPVLVELVEALFLEKRSAIVVFDAPSPEKTALRLLTAFWPGMRRRFSLCTFALSPRKLSGKSFDLLFAPKSARTHFSNWEGRRIETATKAATERHRWTSLIVQRIFCSHIPHLLDADSVRVLVGDYNEENENIVRLTFLWEELREKAIEVPTAVLGLIDIANSCNAVISTWEILEPAIANAVTSAADSMDTESAWNFLRALLGKLENDPITGIISKALCSAGIKLTQRDWVSALTYLASEVPVEKANSEELFQSVATSLTTVDPDKLTEALVAVSPKQLLIIALLDDGLLAHIFSATDATIDASLIRSLTQGFRLLTPKERSEQGLRFLPHIRGDQDAALLAQIIADAQTTQLVEVVNLIWGAKAIRTPQIGKVLCDAATANDSKLKVRAAFARLGDDEQTNRCIERLLVADPTDMIWLLENVEIGSRRTTFLNNFIKESNPDNLAHAFSSAKIATKALNLLAGDLKQFASPAARIVALPTIAAVDHITLGLKIYPMLQGAERAILAQSVFSRVLTDSAVQDGDLPERVIATMLNDIDLQAMITMGLDSDQDGKQISRNLVAFDRVAPAVRTLLEAHVSLIVQLVASRRDFDLTKDGAMAIARLIQTAAQLDYSTHVKICSTIFPFAVDARQKPASPIIIATFPTIYDGLRKGSDNFKLMKPLIFADWGKCKIARKNLVRAFVTSKWPPIDLAVTAFYSHELDRILKRLLKEPRGSSYLAKVEKSAQRLEKVIREPILKTIKEVRNSSSFIPDLES